MGQTLRIYAIRQVALPTMMALLTITFIFMIQSIYQVINLLLLPDVTLLQVSELLALLLPSIIVFSTPMAILIGSLIGVGRMALDREVLAIRASGINLLSVFVPTLAGGFLLSLLIFLLSGQAIPSSLYNVQLKQNDLELAASNALQPGQFYNMKKMGGDAVLYFKGRDPVTNGLVGVVVEKEEDVKVSSKTPDSDAAPPASGAAASQAAPLTSPTLPQGNDIPASSTAKTAVKPPKPASKPSSKPSSSKQKPSAADRAKQTAVAEASDQQTELKLIFAKTGKLEIEQIDEGDGAPPDSEVVLTLKDGTINELSADPEEPENVVIDFDSVKIQSFKPGEVEKRQHTLSTAILKRQIAELEKTQGKHPDKDAGVLRKELWQRRAMWLATFVFMLVGIPLAIWVRPSGKSWGILLAIGLLLIYYVILQTGLTMISNARTGGVLVTMLPNLVYGLIGAYFWRQTLRS